MARTSAKVQEIQGLLEPDGKASWVTNLYHTWRSGQQKWLEGTKECRDYIFQTDTSTTTNRKLPWKNSTSTPKLAQIRDNLHANYMAALFPHDNWFKWHGSVQDPNAKATALKIESYMVHKIRESKFKDVISKCLYDYIDYGNAFGEAGYEQVVVTDESGVPTIRYAGPKLYRWSPYDMYFDLAADSFEDAAKVTRRLVSFGSLKAAHERDPINYSWVPEALAKTQELRMGLSSYGDSDIDKAQGIQHDGFGPLSNYFRGNNIELLEYEGDFYDADSGELYTNRRIVVMDRKWVVHEETIPSWLGRDSKEHVGWRDRPDNLYGMGPLENLVGMQYRIDHLENLKADVFDQIAHPMVYQRGDVEEWEWGPGRRIYGDTDSEVRTLSPDTTSLTADFQINELMDRMEEMAGAPKQAMGIRTPGEKTAFEVQALENAAGRIFQQKIQKFEEQFVEPLLNQMLEQARRNISATETVQLLSDDLAVAEFVTIKKDDLNKRGKLYPIGARHFAAQAQIAQNLLGMVGSPAYQDPAVSAHISGKKIARLFEENLNLSKFELVEDNIRIAEQQETQSLTTQAQEAIASQITSRMEMEDEEPLV